MICERCGEKMRMIGRERFPGVTVNAPVTTMLYKCVACGCFKTTVDNKDIHELKEGSHAATDAP